MYDERTQSPPGFSTDGKMNDVDYLRTEQGDLVALCGDLLAEVFGVSNQQEMDLTVDGFALDES